MAIFCVKSIVLCCLIFATVLPQNVSSAKILSISFRSTRSHKITYEPLLEALAARGHEVIVVSPVPAKKTIKNITEILTIDVDKITAAMPNMMQQKEQNKSFSIFDMIEVAVKTCSESLDLPQVQALRSQKFDLVFVPAIINECTLAFVSTFNTNIILISPLSVPAYVADLFGNPNPLSFVPNVLIGYTDKMNFFERVINFGAEFMYRLIGTIWMMPAVEEAYRAKLGPETPGVFELFENVSLVLSNSHFSISTIRPFLPNIVEVGGMHCRPAQPLPKNLEDFVSSSGDDGFILFSMGSLLKGSAMSEGRRKTLVNVFSKLKQKVLWKWETEEMEDLPNNVKLSTWVPQQDVLGHPKIKAFITHGGFGSTTEAVYHGVPIIGLPVFGDQEINMQIAKRLEFGIVLDFNTFTEESLLEAIHNITYNPQYKKQATAISSSFRDQPNHPLNRAVFWSEYVIRHNGAKHLRSAGRDLNFFQYHSIDVIGFIAGVLLTAVYIILKISKILFKIIRNFIFPKSSLDAAQIKKRM